MTAITKARNTPQLQGYPLPASLKFPVAHDEVLYQGTLCMIKGGYLYDAATTTGAQGVGMVDPNQPELDNTGGGDGDLVVAVIPGVFRWGNSANADLIAQDDVGELCYMVDNQTVALTDGTASRSIAGTIVAVDADGVWVYSNLAAPVDATALAAEIAARQDFEADIASTSLGEGAALVGINDVGNLYTGTTVEAAMQELIGGARIATLADGALTPGVMVIHEFAVPDAASGHTDYVLADKIEVVDVVVRKDTTNGGAGDTLTIGNGATAITDAISIAINAKLLARAASIDPAQAVIPAGGTLRINWNKVTNVKCQVSIIAIKRA